MRSSNDRLALACALIAMALSFAFVDVPLLHAVREFRSRQPELFPLLTSLDTFVNVISHGLTLFIAAMVLLLAGWRFNRRLFEAGRALVISFISSGLLAQALKHLFGRARPRITDTIQFIGPSLRGSFDSFPSGHTTVAFCFAYTLSMHFPRFRAIFYLLAVIAGLDRVENTAHFLSDVIAGAIVGIVAGKLLFSRMPSFVSSRTTVMDDQGATAP